jgi:hypothetical protein
MSKILKVSFLLLCKTLQLTGLNCKLFIRRSNRYISTRDALRDGDLDPLTGMYGNMNLLEARSKGYLLSTDAMVRVHSNKM